MAADWDEHELFNSTLRKENLFGSQGTAEVWDADRLYRWLDAIRGGPGTHGIERNFQEDVINILDAFFPIPAKDVEDGFRRRYMSPTSRCISLSSTSFFCPSSR